MLDGDQNTRWSSGQSQIAEQWLELEFGRVELLELLELRTAAGDMPRELELELDGAPASQTSSMAVPGVLRLELEQPTAASSARIAIVTPAANALAWWSVTELGGLCR